jgi:hypothetical protein
MEETTTEVVPTLYRLPDSGQMPSAVARKRRWPLIRYAGSATETSIGQKPVGNGSEPESIHSCAGVKRRRRGTFFATPQVLMYDVASATAK